MCFFSTLPIANAALLHFSRNWAASSRVVNLVSSVAFTFTLFFALCGWNTPVTLKYGVELNAIISLSLSTISLTATDCTLPAESFGATFFQRIGESSNPTSLSSTLRACCAITRLLSIERGFSMALRIALFVISWKTIRFVFSSLRFRAWNRCHAMASPSRSSSDASHTVSAFFARLLSSETTFFLSSEISYTGSKPFSIFIPRFFFSRSLM